MEPNQTPRPDPEATAVPRLEGGSRAYAVLRRFFLLFSGGAARLYVHIHT